MLKQLLILTIFLLPTTTKNNKQKDWLKQVNDLRTMVNAPHLKYDPLLSFQCARYARKIARTGKFVHDPNLRNQGENIAMSTDPSVDPIEIWRNSAGHYRNLVSKDYKKVGLGIASNGQETYFVMRLK